MIFEAEIARSFRVPSSGAFPPLINDFIYTKLVVNKQLSYAVDTPLDALVDIRGKSGLALELKEFQTKSSFPLSRLPDHQLNGLRSFAAIGRTSYLLVCYRHWRLLAGEKIGLSKSDLRREEGRRAYAIPLGTLDVLLDECEWMERKSIAIERIQSVGIRIPAIQIPTPSEKYPNKRAPGWDISVLLN